MNFHHMNSAHHHFSNGDSLSGIFFFIDTVFAPFVSSFLHYPLHNQKLPTGDLCQQHSDLYGTILLPLTRNVFVPSSRFLSCTRFQLDKYLLNIQRSFSFIALLCNSPYF